MENLKTIEINLDSVFNTKRPISEQTKITVSRYFEILAENFNKAKAEGK